MTQLTTQVPAPSLQGTAFVQQGVADTSIATALQGAGQLIGNIAPSQKQRETTAQRTALGGFAEGLLNLEEEEAQAQQQLFDLQNQIANSADQVKVQELRQQYVRLVQAEQSGANPMSIAARKRALLRNQLVANPHLTQDINRIANLIDGQVSLADPQNDPVLQATNEIARRAMEDGITIDMQIEAANLTQAKQRSEAELAIRRNTGSLNFTAFANDAVQQSSHFGMELNRHFLDLSADPEFTGLNAEQQKLAINQQVNAFVSQNMQRYVEEAQAGKFTFTADQMNALRTNLENSITAAIFPIISQLDKGVQLQRQTTALRNEQDMARLLGVEKWRAYNEENRILDDLSGGDPAVRLSTMGALGRLEQVRKRRGSGTAEQLAATEPELLTLGRMFNKTPQQLVNDMSTLVRNPQATIGDTDDQTRQLITQSLAGGVATTEGGKKAEADKLPVAFMAEGPTAARQMLGDQIYNKVIGNKHLYTKVKNMASSEVFQIARGLAEEVAEANGKVVFAHPNGPLRIPQGKGKYRPAEAFRFEHDGTAVTGVRSKNALEKLNAMYAILVNSGQGDFARQWAQGVSETFDTEATEYNIRELEEMRNTATRRMSFVRARPNYATEAQRTSEIEMLQRQVNEYTAQIKTLKGEGVVEEAGEEQEEE